MVKPRTSARPFVGGRGAAAKHVERQWTGGALDALNLPLIVADRKGRVRYLNPAAASALSDKDSVAALFAEARMPAGFRGWPEEFSDILRRRRGAQWNGVAHRTRQGAPILWDVVCNPIPGSTSDRPLGLLLTLFDAREGASPRTDGEDRLVSIGKLAAKVAHELNNPLDGVLRYINLSLRLLARQIRQVEDHEVVGKLAEYLEESRTGLNRMTQIVRDLLEFSRGMNLGRDQSPINVVVEDAMRNVSSLAQEKGVVVAADFQTQDMPTISAGRLFQICLNLMKNALDAMPDGGRLMIRAGIVGSEVILRFADTGPGIPEVDRDRIFEPFFTTKPAGKGAGLGLAICKDLVERLGGTIDARNGEKQGAVFTVRIPLEACRTSS